MKAAFQNKMAARSLGPEPIMKEGLTFHNRLEERGVPLGQLPTLYDLTSQSGSGTSCDSSLLMT